MVSRKDCPMNIMDLNDDCIECILRKLNHFEQFRISKVHTRFKGIIQRIWRLNASRVLVISGYFMAVPGSAQLATQAIVPLKGNKAKQITKREVEDFTDFKDFMLSLTPYVQHFVMHNMPVEQLRLLCDNQFPLVLEFEWIAASSQEAEQLLDEDIVMLKKMFPNLEKLKLRSCQITGKYLAELSSLRKLTLDECHYLESEFFRDVFQTLKLRKFDIMDDCDELNCCDLAELQKCPSLQHIKIADYHLCLEPYILNNILKMPNLSKLSIYSRNFVFDVLERVARNQTKTIEAFKYNGVMVHTERFFSEVGHMKSLKRLYFFECCTFEDYERIHDHCCATISKQLTDLREVHFITCIIQSEEALLQFVANCQELELINVSNARNIGNSFVWRCLEMLKKQRWRHKPLKLWITNTSVDKDILEDPRIMCSQGLLKIDFKKTVVNTNPPGVLKFMFKV